MQQKDIKQLKRLLEQYAMLRRAEDSLAVANIERVIEVIAEDLNVNQP